MGVLLRFSAKSGTLGGGALYGSNSRGSACSAGVVEFLYPQATETRPGLHVCFVDLAGALSKLAPPLARMVSMHRQIRSRTRRFAHREVSCVRQQTRVSEDALALAEARYKAGAKLREIATDVGVSRQRLASLLRARGVRLRRSTPSALRWTRWSAGTPWASRWNAWVPVSCSPPAPSATG